MSYTRPTASAADATWQGSAAYVRPLASAADASFLTGQTASGFTSTMFGSPDTSGLVSGFSLTVFGSATTQITQPASGFVTTQLPTPSVPLLADSVGIAVQLGVPASALTQRPISFDSTLFGSPVVEPRAVGFLTTNLGIPSISLRAEGIVPPLALGVPEGRLYQQAFGIGAAGFGTPQNVPIATGFGPALLGAPSGYQFWRARTTGPVARFSPAYFAFAQTQTASGFMRSKLGSPFGLRFMTPFVDQLCQAFGSAGSFVSAPTSGSLQFGGAIGSASTQLPVPNVACGQSAAAFVLTYFGTPGVSVAAHPISLIPTQIGVPSLRLTQAASPIHKTQFGLPASSRSRTYTAYGFYRGGRVGHPIGFVRINRTATGFCSSGSGTPAALFRNRTASLAPGAYFGQALLVRAPTC